MVGDDIQIKKCRPCFRATELGVNPREAFKIKAVDLDLIKGEPPMIIFDNDNKLIIRSYPKMYKFDPIAIANGFLINGLMNVLLSKGIISIQEAKKIYKTSIVGAEQQDPLASEHLSTSFQSILEAYGDPDDENLIDQNNPDGKQ